MHRMVTSALTRSAVFLLLVGMVAGPVAAKPPKALLDCQDAQSFQSAFPGLGPAWSVTNAGLEGSGPLYTSVPGTQLDGMLDDTHTYFVVHPVDLWRYAMAGSSTWRDYTINVNLRILTSAPLTGHRPGGGSVFINYQWGREAIGTDAAIILRSQNPDSAYMVRFSSDYGHVELWKAKGGVVQVKPYPLKPNQDYAVSVTASGRWILVSIDGQELIRYYDPIEPLLSGQVGLGVRESQVRFSNLTVVPAERIHDAAPVHVPVFSVRQWVGREYVFDGDEPIAWIDPHTGGLLQEVKLEPGLMPMMTLEPGVSWGDVNWAQEVTPVIEKTGDSFSFHVDQTDIAGRSTGIGRLVLTYDPKVGYVWENQGTVKVLVGGKMDKWNLDIADPCFYQSVAPATDKLPQGRTHPNYGLWTRPDGSYGYFPANHQFKNCGDVPLPELQIKRGGFFASTIDDWAAAIELPDDNPYPYYGDYCTWGMDLHIAPIVDPAARNWAVINVKADQGDTFHGRMRVYALPPEKVQQLLTVATLPKADPNISRDLIAHVEPVNDCSDLVPEVAGDSKVRWTGDYQVDHTVGRGGSTSMRLEGNQEASLDAIGPSYRTGPYLAPSYRFGVWIKSADFTGKVTLEASNFLAGDGRKITGPTSASLDVTGAKDWTWIGFENPFPHACHYWSLKLTTEGKGTLWADDFEISPKWTPST